MASVLSEISRYLHEMYNAFEYRVYPVVAFEETLFSTNIKSSIGTAFPVANYGSGTLFVTASHVVKDYEDVFLLIQSPDNMSIIPAEKSLVLWQMGNNIFDIAILYTSSVKVEPMKLGNSLLVNNGDVVVSMGYPLGIVRKPTIVEGLVSANDLELITQLGIMHGIIQTTLPLNPGFSGGPIFNVNGEVVGIARAVIMGAQLMSYATPINFIKPFVKSAIETGTFKYPSLQVVTVLYNPLMKELYRTRYPAVLSCASSLRLNAMRSIVVESYNSDIPPCSAVLSVSVGPTTINNPTPAQIIQALYEAYWEGTQMVMTLQTTSGVITITPRYILKTI